MRGRKERPRAALPHHVELAERKARWNNFVPYQKLEEQHAVWKRQSLRFGPIRARYSGDLLRPEDLAARRFGILGVVNNSVFFVEDSSKLPIASILGFAREENIFRLYCHPRPRWSVHRFEVEDWAADFDQALRDVGIPVAPLFTGPIFVRHLTQDMYGQWTNQGEISILITPDSLITNGRLQLFRFVEIRSLMLSSENVLRISYGSKNEVVGFRGGENDGLAALIAERCGMDLDVVEKQKKNKS
jgi:hypothetical protein